MVQNSISPDSRDRTSDAALQSDAIALVCPVDSALLDEAFENLQRYVICYSHVAVGVMINDTEGLQALRKRYVRFRAAVVRAETK